MCIHIYIYIYIEREREGERERDRLLEHAIPWELFGNMSERIAH